jgi:hypothetical protein
MRQVRRLGSIQHERSDDLEVKGEERFRDPSEPAAHFTSFSDPLH